VPPRFDFAGSDNLKSATMLWPAPHRFPDGAGGHSIGYAGRVIFPMRIVPIDAGKPVTLRIKADYAVCEKLCVPAAGKAELKLTAGVSAEDSALAAAEARVPRPVKLGETASLAIRSAHRDLTGSRPRVVVEVAAPQGMQADLFAEGPAPEWAFPLPEPEGDATAAARRFTFEVDGVPPDAKVAGVLLKLTLVAGETAIEVSTPLD
jgi:DsbC/DsbD-like thiol-disulfide interchange protein